LNLRNLQDLPSLEFEVLEAQTIAIDWRSGESEILEAISKSVDESGELTSVFKGEQLFFSWRNTEYKVPLTYTHHDRYVTLSSVAEVLKNEYQFWLLTDRLRDDTHSLLILPMADSIALEKENSKWVIETLTKFIPGTDYFSKLQVPYFGNESNNPKFRSQARSLRYKEWFVEICLRAIFRVVMFLRKTDK
jgi:hypothetical protein